MEIKIISVKNSFCSLISSLSSINIISLWSAFVLFGINGFTIFQKCLVFMGPFLHFSLKCSLIACLLSLTQVSLIFPYYPIKGTFAFIILIS